MLWYPTKINFPYNLRIVSIWLKNGDVYISTKKFTEVKKTSPKEIVVTHNPEEPLEVRKISNKEIEKVGELKCLKENPLAPILFIKGKYKFLSFPKLKEASKFINNF